MTDYLKTEGSFTYAEAGEGPSIIVLHGLMGTLSNFKDTFHHFSENGYNVLIPADCVRASEPSRHIAALETLKKYGSVVDKYV